MLLLLVLVDRTTLPLSCAVGCWLPLTGAPACWLKGRPGARAWPGGGMAAPGLALLHQGRQCSEAEVSRVRWK